MFYIKLDKYKVISYKEGAIYKTKRIGFEWFIYSDVPPANVVVDEHFWAYALESCNSNVKPLNSEGE